MATPSTGKRKTARQWVDGHGFGMFWSTMSREWRKKLAKALRARPKDEAASRVFKYKRLLKEAETDYEVALSADEVKRETLREFKAMRAIIDGRGPCGRPLRRSEGSTQ